MKGIRGHHLFCMALFTGHGYSEAFAGNMARAIQDIKTGEPLRLVRAPDDICACCPNLLPGGGCALGTEDVRRRDRAAFQVLGVSPGDELGWQQAREMLLGVSGEGFQAVCGGCRWAKEGLCSLALLQKQLA